MRIAAARCATDRTTSDSHAGRRWRCPLPRRCRPSVCRSLRRTSVSRISQVIWTHHSTRLIRSARRGNLKFEFTENSVRARNSPVVPQSKYSVCIYEQSRRLQSSGPLSAARDYSDICAALEWCFSPRGDPLIGCNLVVVVVPLLLRLSLLAECQV
jgi:hypothetical protein